MPVSVGSPLPLDHEVPDGPVRDGAIIIVLLAELDEILSDSWGQVTVWL